jgi:hypothetical protein
MLLSSPLAPYLSRTRSRRLFWCCLASASTSFLPVARCYASRSYSSMSFVTERSGDGTITVSPKNEGDQSALVVICHGLGDTAEGFADVAEVCTIRIDSTRWRMKILSKESINTYTLSFLFPFLFLQPTIRHSPGPCPTSKSFSPQPPHNP